MAEERRVAFFPGAMGSGEFWRPVCDQLPTGWAARLYDWPGAGAQPHDPAIAGYRDLIARTAERLSHGSDIVAQSMGGVIAIGVALARPDKVRRLVLVATSGGLDVESAGAADWQRDYAAQFPLAAAWVTGERIDFGAELARVTAATRLIWGDADPVSPLAVGERLRAALPDCDLCVIPGGTHALAREYPAEVARLIVQHLGSTERASVPAAGGQEP